jgi:hypothetical protein
MPLSAQYKRDRETDRKKGVDAFEARINEIVFIPERNYYIWGKGTSGQNTIDHMTTRGDKWEVKGEQK